MDDNRILALYRKRDSEAIRFTREKYGNYCFAVASRILPCREDAEECVLDTWLGAWNAIPPQCPTHLRLFLARITRNLAFNRWKAQTAEKRGGGELPLVLEELDECLASPGDVEGEVIAGELAESVRGFLAKLPERECNVFLRRYFYAEAVKDIGARYGLKPDHVSVILLRTRKKLREHLTREGYFDE